MGVREDAGRVMREVIYVVEGKICEGRERGREGRIRKVKKSLR